MNFDLCSKVEEYLRAASFRHLVEASCHVAVGDVAYSLDTRPSFQMFDNGAQTRYGDPDNMFFSVPGHRPTWLRGFIRQFFYKIVEILFRNGDWEFNHRRFWIADNSIFLADFRYRPLRQQNFIFSYDGASWHLFVADICIIQCNQQPSPYV